MGILTEAENNLKTITNISMSGMKLIGYTKKMIENMDNIIELFENMDDEWKQNWIKFLGEENFNQAQKFYQAIKSFREHLKQNGLD